MTMYKIFIVIVSLLLVVADVNCINNKDNNINNENNNGLRQGFYFRSCPQAERIVRNIVWSKARSNPALAAKLIRMHFHDCFVKGCDASILLDKVGSIPSEKDSIPNQTVSGFEVIDEIKSQVEIVCPGVVSCADIIALAARDAVSFPFRASLWEVYTGRRDGSASLASNVFGNIPSPFSNFSTLLQVFSSKGLTSDHLVILSGAHTIGVAHCGTFSNRLYNFTGKGDADPSLDATYAQLLRTQCPNPADTSTTVEMDPKSSLSFDKHYYTALVQNQGLFQSDAALLTDPSSARKVRQLQFSNSFLFEFGRSMVKMGAIEVLTGSNGEVRKNCRVVN